MADPRVLEKGVSISDLKKQETLALQVLDLLSEAKRKAHDLDKKIKSLDPQAKEERQKLEQLKSKLVRAHGRYTPTRFINQVGYLFGILNRGDQVPGADVYERYQELVEEFQGIVD